MKKALVVLLALTTLGAAMAFADDAATVTFSGKLYTGVRVTPNSEDDATWQLYDADTPSATRSRLYIAAFLGDFGVTYAFYGVAPDTTSTDPNATLADTPIYWGETYIWTTANFLDKMVQVNAGKIDNSVSDTVNKGWGGVSVQGLQFVVAPIDGLKIGYGLPATIAVETLTNGFEKSAIGFSYTMPSMAIIKATYINGGTDKNNFYAGVEIDAVPNLLAQVEAQLLLLGDETLPNATAYGKNEIFVNATYALGALTPGIELDVVLYGNSDVDTTFSIKPKVDYVLMPGTAVGASVAYIINGLNSDFTGQFDSGLVIDPYVKFTFNPKMALKIDAAYTLPDLSDTGVWTFPISINFLYTF